MSKVIDTQKSAIRDYLLLGLPLTPLDAWRMFSCSKLSTRCGELERDNQLPTLIRKRVKVKTKYGSTLVTQYQIPQTISI